MMLIVTMLTVFAGCGNKDDRTQAAKKLNLSGPITVNVWYNDSAYESYLEFVARQFKKSNELVTVKPIYIEADSYINYIYDESVRNNNACDIYFLTSEEMEKAYLSGLTSENDMYPEVYNENVYGKAAMTACSYGGKLYGYPVSFNTSFLVYNKKYAEAVDTIDQIRNISDNYQITDENQDVSMVFEWDPDSMFINYAAAGAYINIGGVNAENRAEVSLNEEKIKKVLTKYAQLKDAFGIDRNTVSLKECADLFSTGNMLYTVLDADSLAEINVTDVDLVFTGEMPENVRVGKSFRVQIELGQPEQAIVIPRGNFYQSTGGQWIYKINPSKTKAVKVPLNIGRQNPLQYEITEGLQPGEFVIITGYDTFGDAEELILK